jgi:hypothetical protein
LPAEEKTSAVEALRAQFKTGDAVRVPRYGSGQVTQVAGEEVTVVFPDASLRTFLSSYVESPPAVEACP